MKIIVLGSTGHIGKGLVHYFSQDKNNKLFLIKRGELLEYSNLPYDIDIIINCIGKGNRNKLNDIDYESFREWDDIDDRVIDILKHNHNICYFYLSSWIAGEPLLPTDHHQYIYQVQKIYTETKHRLLPELKIIDIRIKQYFSRWIDIDSGFLITDLLKQKYFNGKEVKIKKPDYDLRYMTPEYLYFSIIKLFNYKYPNHGVDLWKELYYISNIDLKYYIINNNTKIKLYYLLSNELYEWKLFNNIIDK